MIDRTGQQFGNYRIVRLIGGGDFAHVYLAEHVYLHTHVALKMLRTQLTNEAVRKFWVEANTVAHLKHPHIIQILDFGVERNIPYLVMEPASSTVYDRYYRDLPLPLDIIMSYVKQLASALQYIHDRELVHGDIYPRNLLLRNDREIVLSDFGFTTMTHSTNPQRKTLPQPQFQKGTVEYMAPEQFLGKPRRRSDQYALGVVVYEWLTGRLPFSGPNQQEIVYQQMNVPPPPLRERIPSLSPTIEQVVLRTLSKNPKMRFADVQEFAAALEQASLA